MNFETIKEYYTKSSDFISSGYSGVIHKHELNMNFLDRKPVLKKVLKANILSREVDDRTVQKIA